MFNSRKFLVTFILMTIIFFSLAFPAAAVNSGMYNTDGTRLYLSSGNKFYVYVEEGDTVYIGTSSKSDRYDVRIMMPDLEKRLYKLNEISEGYIENRTQELAGPIDFSADGYIPIKATAQQTGYIEVTLYGSNKNISGAQTEAPWELCSEDGCLTAAWDITVADKNGNIKTGRVFSKKLTMNDGQRQVNGLNIYALTEDGYLYLFTSGRLNGGEWTISAGNRGIVHIPTNKMIYSSVQNSKDYKRDYMIGIEDFGRTIWMEEPKIISFQTTGYVKDGEIHRYDKPKKAEVFTDPTVFDPGFRRSWYGDSLCRLFLEEPAVELLEYIKLTEPLPAPTAENINLIRHKDNTYTLSFDSEYDYGVYELRILFVGEDKFKRTVSLGNYVDYYNELNWDGKDNKGNLVGDEPFAAQLFIKSGEAHFDLDDIEYIYDGIKIKNINASGSSQVYYDNEEAVIDGSHTWINVLHCNDEELKCKRVNYSEKGSLIEDNDESKVLLLGKVTRKKGIDSYVGISMKTDREYSDGLMIDVWTFDPNYNTYNISAKPEATNTPTLVPSTTATFAATATPTATLTEVPTATATHTVMPTATATFTATPTPTATFTPVSAAASTFTTTSAAAVEASTPTIIPSITPTPTWSDPIEIIAVPIEDSYVLYPEATINPYDIYNSGTWFYQDHE